MIPEERLSTAPVVSSFLHPEERSSPFVDYDQGGVALNDPSLGLSVKLWTLRYFDGAFRVSAPGVPSTLLFSRSGEVSWASLTFDQNMNPFVAFTEDGVSKFWWYDPTQAAQVFEESLIATAETPCCTLDDRRPTRTTESDIILAYLRNGNLYYRQQRERFLTERLLKTGVGGKLLCVGMNDRYRLQFKIRDATDTNVMSATPYLADVVLDLCRRAGLPENVLDVRELYDDIVYGYRVANTEGVDEAIKPLSEAYRFDPVEFDKKLRFHKRGRTPALRVKWTDLVAKDPPMKRTRVQEDLLPVRVNVNHLDPAGGYAKNKQGAQRRSNQVRTKREDKYEFDFALPADIAATIALRELKRPYYEQMRYEFELPLKFTHLTCSDVIEFEDKDGTVELIRLEEINRENGVLEIRGVGEGGADVYGTTATGLSLQPPRSTTPGVIGETRVEILNLPVLRDQNDELGLVVAMAGSSSAWSGAQLMTSSDNGLTFVEAFRTAVPSIIGDTVTPLAAENGYLYPTQQFVDVRTNFELASTTEEALLAGANKAVIGDEIIQFRTATFLGDNTWRLTGLIRGRYNTVADAWPVDTRFVMLDESLIFVQLQRWMIGTDFVVKGVGFGSTIDEAMAIAYLVEDPVSQIEWPVHNLTAVRDGSNNLIISFVPRARLGVETTPYNSKYFRGFRIKFSDGFSVDTLSTTYTRTGTVPPLTFTVHALNEITGEGPASEAVTA